jgi:hypothetical protein
VIASGLLCTALAFGADDQYQTQGLTNGRFWAMMPQLAKITFVTAYCEGYLTAMSAAQFAVHDDAAASKKIGAKNEIATANYLNYNEVAQEVESLYKDPLNRGLPIGEIITISIKKFTGESDRDIARRLDTLRTIYLKASQ